MMEMIIGGTVTTFVGGLAVLLISGQWKPWTLKPFVSTWRGLNTMYGDATIYFNSWESKKSLKARLATTTQELIKSEKRHLEDADLSRVVLEEKDATIAATIKEKDKLAASLNDTLEELVKAFEKNARQEWKMKVSERDWKKKTAALKTELTNAIEEIKRMQISSKSSRDYMHYQKLANDMMDKAMPILAEAEAKGIPPFDNN